MLYEFFDLVDPLGFEHVLLDGPDCAHQTGHVLDEDVVSCNEQLFLLDLLLRLPSLVESRQQLLLSLSADLILSACGQSLTSLAQKRLLRGLREPFHGAHLNFAEPLLTLR